MLPVRLTVFSVLYLLVLLGVWWFQRHGPVDSAVHVALTYSPQFFWLIPLGLLMALAFRRKNWAALDVQAITLLVLLWLLMGFRLPPTTACEGPSFKVLSYSTHQGQVSAFVLQDLLTVQAPQVVLLQDPGPARSSYLSMARQQGWQVADARHLLTLSRLPIVHKHLLPSGRALLTDVKLGKRVVRLLNVNLPEVRNPLTLQQDALQHQHVLREGLALLKNQNTLVGGNFNAGPQGSWIQPLQRQHRESVGWGLGFTYPAFLPVERKDQLWLGEGLCSQAHEVLPERGSDHRAILAVLSVK